MAEQITENCMRCDGRKVVVIKPHGAVFAKKKCPMCKGTGKAIPVKHSKEQTMDNSVTDIELADEIRKQVRRLNALIEFAAKREMTVAFEQKQAPEIVGLIARPEFFVKVMTEVA